MTSNLVSFSKEGDTGSTRFGADLRRGISNLCGSVSLSSLIGSGVAPGGGTGDGVVMALCDDVFPSLGGGVLDGVAGLQHRTQQHTGLHTETMQDNNTTTKQNVRVMSATKVEKSKGGLHEINTG